MPTNNFASEIPKGVINYLQNYLQERNDRIDKDNDRIDKESFDDTDTSGDNVSKRGFTKNFDDSDYDDYSEYEG